MAYLSGSHEGPVDFAGYQTMQVSERVRRAGEDAKAKLNRLSQTDSTAWYPTIAFLVCQGVWPSPLVGGTISLWHVRGSLGGGWIFGWVALTG